MVTGSGAGLLTKLKKIKKVDKVYTSSVNKVVTLVIASWPKPAIKGRGSG
ncbi:hypothetical protein NBG4_10010 [Candidatus Sulfobium mesophilum]|uniref:Uncharacterized protein n=1 Tax=Candidatus Sulfobium mesophilum TaxID=2016548 RepID=A0A2U3QDI6_9BACT|nr:hypothetical protein NBG4_10010 [Candidatus Sulfobium mesophilum]